MHIVLISTPIGFLGSGKGGGVELTLNSLVSGLLSLEGPLCGGYSSKNSKLYESNKKAKLHFVEGEDQISWQHQNFDPPVIISNNSVVAGLIEKALSLGRKGGYIIKLFL